MIRIVLVAIWLLSPGLLSFFVIRRRGPFGELKLPERQFPKIPALVLRVVDAKRSYPE